MMQGGDMTGNKVRIDGQEEGGGRDLFKASHEHLLIMAALRLLLC